MRQYLKDFKTEFDGRLNYGIMNHEYDRPLVDHVIDCFKSLEIVKGIKILSWTYSEEEQEINTDKYQKKRKEIKKSIGKKRCKTINDDRLGVLRIMIEISTTSINKNGEKTTEKAIVNKVVLLPIIENGYIHLKGKKFYLIYQMVDKSTYDNKNSVVLKSLMPIRVSRYDTTAVDGTDSSKIYKLPMYKIEVRKKQVNVLLYYASRPGGLAGALDYLGVRNVIQLVDKIRDTDRYIYLSVSSDCYIEIEKNIFNESIYIRAVAGMISDATSNRFNISMMYDETVFLKKLSNTGTIEKGKDELSFFNRLLDVGTTKTILTDEINKIDIYALIRYMMLEFNKLRSKDYNSLYNQRLRVNEYIAQLLNIEFSNKLQKIMKKGSNVTMTDLKKFFKFDPFILINKLQASGILRFNQCINDMSQFFSKFKYTTKGPHSIGGKGTKGGKNNNEVALDKRWIHPSSVGLIDLTVCSHSDPGRSGIISPFCKLDSLYFSEEPEPDDVMYNLSNRITQIMNNEENVVIQLNCQSKDEFYKVLHDIEDVKSKCNIYVTSTDNIIIDNLGILVDDDTDENSSDDGDDDNENYGDTEL